MSVLFRSCVTRRLPRFSRHPLWQATSPSTSSRSPVSRAPSVIEVDLLDLDSQNGPAAEADSPARHRVFAIHLRVDPYASGSRWSRTKTFMVNVEQIMSSYYRDRGERCSAGHHSRVVAAVLSRHGFDMWELSSRFWADFTACSPARRRSCSDRRGGCNCWQATVTHFRQHRTLLSNWRHAKTSDDDMAGLDLGDVRNILNGAERVQPATLRRFAERFARFNLDPRALRPSYGLAEATVYVATRESDQPPETVYFESEELTAGHAKRCASGRRYTAGQLRYAAVADGAYRRSRDPYRVSGGNRR